MAAPARPAEWLAGSIRTNSAEEAMVEEQGADPTTVRELRERLEALAHRVEEQQATIARLEEAGRPICPDPTEAAVGRSDASQSDAKVGRRGMLTKVLGATAAAAVLTVAREAGTARAEAAATLVGGSTNLYGVAASPGVGLTLPSLAGNFFGVIGSQSTAAPSPDAPSGVLGLSDFHVGVQGRSNQGNGVRAFSRDQIGIWGISGQAGPVPPLTGIWGTARDRDGVTGTSTNVSGVFGISGALGPGLGPPAGVTGTSVARYGVLGTSGANFGVFGLSTQTAGVLGSSTQGSGVFGTSPVYGMWGRATGTGTGSIGVRGDAAGSGIGVYGTAGPGGFAGYFNGPVFIKGVGVLGTAGPQAAAQPAAQTVESFGSARLENGQATVTLDEATATAIAGGEYQVVLTEVGDAGGLFLASQGPRSFEVRARKPGAGNAFHYRIMARGSQPSRRGTNAEATPSVPVPKDIPIPELPKAEPSRPGVGPERQQPADAR